MRIDQSLNEEIMKDNIYKLKRKINKVDLRENTLTDHFSLKEQWGLFFFLISILKFKINASIIF